MDVVSMVMKEPPTKLQKWLKLIGINLVPFGLELCASAGFAYIPPVILKTGFSESCLSVLLGIGPFISLFLVPSIGRWSDKCQSSFGRRRPFMLIFGILMFLSLIIIPFNEEIVLYTGETLNNNFTLAVGVVLLDFSSQALMNPCKALIPDIFHTPEEQSSGFIVYSCMMSLGGCIGYLITSFNWNNTLVGILFGSQEKAVFSVLAFLLLILLTINLSVAREMPFTKKLIPNCAVVNMKGNYCSLKIGSKFYIFGDIKLSNLSRKLSRFNSESMKNCFVSVFSCVSCMLSNIMSSCTKWSIRCVHPFIVIPVKLVLSIQCSFNYFINMPPVLLHLFKASLFGWMAIMCHDMYYSDFVGQVIYHGRPKAGKESMAVTLYDQGVRMGSLGLLLHCLSGAIYAAFFQEKLIKIFGQRKVYILGMVLLSLSLLGTALTSNIKLANIFAVSSGPGLAAITTVPYSLVTEYYSAKEMYYDSDADRGIAEDMAVLDSSFFLAQIVPSVFLGSIVNYTQSSSTYMITAAICGTAATYFSFFIIFPSN